MPVMTVQGPISRNHLGLSLPHERLFSFRSHLVGDRSHPVGDGGNGFAYIPTRFVPRLDEAGLGDEQIQVLLAENPRRPLTGER